MSSLDESVAYQLIVQIRLLQTCLDYLEKCSKGISPVAYLCPPMDTAIYVSFIYQSKPNSSSASLASRHFMCYFSSCCFKIYHSVQNNEILFCLCHTFYTASNVFFCISNIKVVMNRISLKQENSCQLFWHVFHYFTDPEYNNQLIVKGINLVVLQLNWVLNWPLHINLSVFFQGLVKCLGKEAVSVTCIVLLIITAL